MTQGTKNPVGRPKKTLDCLPDDWEQKMYEMAEEGASEIELRVMLHISDDLWFRFIDEEPDFSRAVKRAKQLCQVWWERHGRKMATGARDGNPTVWIFNMKNRFRWADRVEQDNTSSDGSFKPTTINLVGVAPSGDSGD